MANGISAMDEHCRRCAAQINQGEFDVLFANSCSLFRVTAIGRHVKIPSALHLGEPYRSLYEALPRLPWLALPRSSTSPWAWRSIKRFTKDLVRVQAMRLQAREEVDNAAEFDQILVNSHFSRESILRTYGLDARVSYLGIAADRFRPLGVPRERLIVGVGSIAHHKGVDIAIRAVATIPEKIRPALVWIGNMVDGHYRREVEALAESLRVSLMLRIDVSDEELVRELSRAAVMVYTSRLEPFGLAPLEASACETPVVAVAEGGVRETIRDGENGILVPNRRPEQIGEALLRLLDDPKLARRLGAQGREGVVKQWSWKAAVNRVESVLYDVSRR
jgi:glycosyltransferase involved in cell wall biosynthesis